MASAGAGARARARVCLAGVWGKERETLETERLTGIWMRVRTVVRQKSVKPLRILH